MFLSHPYHECLDICVDMDVNGCQIKLGISALPNSLPSWGEEVQSSPVHPLTRGGEVLTVPPTQVPTAGAPLDVDL